MTIPDWRLLTPPREEEEVYPYRRVWRSIVLESGIVFVTTIIVFVVINILGFTVPKTLHRPIGVALACLPLGLWLLFSLWRERFVPEPRQGMLGVAVISALVVNAVGIPLINDFLQVDRWLPLSSAINRIVGYTLTVGAVQEFLKYLVVRYTVWSSGFRIRLDGVAFGAASAVGYLTVLNLYFVLTASPAPDVVASLVFTNVSMHFITSVLVGYGLSQLRFGDPNPFLLPIMVAFAALVTGFAIPVDAGLVNAGLGLTVSATKPLLGIIFSAVLLYVGIAFLVFLFNNAERQAKEAAAEEESFQLTFVEIRSGPERLTQRQRWSLYLTIIWGVSALIIGVNLKESALNETTTYVDNQAGIRVDYPRSWLLDTGPDYVFRARDISRIGFKTTLQISIRPVSVAEINERNVLDALTLSRAQVLASYSVQSIEPFVLPDGIQATRMNYTFVSVETNPFLESEPVVIQGVDILINRRGQVVIITLLADKSTFDEDFSVFERFLSALEV